jgi:hypothetical protein
MGLLDELDITILAFIADYPNSTITDCAKTIFETKNTEELQKKDSFLRHRFKALSEANYLNFETDGSKKKYQIVKENVSFGPELRGINIGGKKFIHPDIKKDYCIILFTNDGVIVRSLDKIETKWRDKGK